MITFRTVIPAILAGTILAGCAGDPSKPGSALPDTGALVAAVQEYTQRACGFLPYIDNAMAQSLIAAYFPAGVAISVGAAAIGRAICAGSTPKAARKLVGASTYKIVSTPRGAVRVPGKYVR